MSSTNKVVQIPRYILTFRPATFGIFYEKQERRTTYASGIQENGEHNYLLLTYRILHVKQISG